MICPMYICVKTSHLEATDVVKLIAAKKADRRQNMVFSRLHERMKLMALDERTQSRGGGLGRGWGLDVQNIS